MDTRKIKKWMNGWMNEPGFSPDTSVVPCQNLCTTDPNSFVHLSLALCTLSNWCHHSITHLKKEVFLCFYSVIVNCSLFVFHKSRLGYNPEDMDIVMYILSNIFRINLSIKIKNTVYKTSKKKINTYESLGESNMLKPSKQLSLNYFR